MVWPVRGKAGQEHHVERVRITAGLAGTLLDLLEGAADQDQMRAALAPRGPRNGTSF